MNQFNDAPVAALSETSYSQQARPMLVSWGARGLYLGPAWNLAAHRNAVAVLAIGLDAPLGVALDPANPALGFTQCRTALIAPNELHLLATPGMHYAFLYVDALSHDFSTLHGRCRRRVGAVGFDLDGEEALLLLLGTMERSAEGWQASSDRLAGLLALHPAGADKRIRKVADALMASPADETDTAGHALQVGLSSSRFQHLFKEQTGVPFRRYRLWMRLQGTMMKVLSGRTLTEAAHECGFSSSAHLSAAFKDMFGLPLTQLLSGRVLFVRS